MGILRSSRISFTGWAFLFSGICRKKEDFEMINVTLKGGAVKEFGPGVSAADVAKSIGMGLYKSACAARVDGEAVDLRTPL